MAEKQYFYANGKRKTAVARVRVYPGGTGKITVNGVEPKEYFSTSEMVGALTSPLKLTDNAKAVDVTIVVAGGGLQAQSEACRHGIARGLSAMDTIFRAQLKPAGMLTRDARVKERKKYGLKRARRAPQWCKR